MAAHAKLPPSGAPMWFGCSASIRMCEKYPYESSSFADEGSVAHWVAEQALTNQRPASFYIGVELKKYPGHEVTEEMADYVQQYVDLCNGLPGAHLVETRLDLSEWIPDGFGTSDFIAIEGKTAYIVDLKYGQGVKVHAKRNKQAMIYALGMLSFYLMFYSIETVHIIICQPRLDHIDEWLVSVDDLLLFGEEVKEKAALALSDNPAFNPGPEQCRWCRAKAECPALTEFCLKQASEGFEDLDKPVVFRPTEQSPEDLGKILPNTGLIKDWAKAIETHARALLLKGVRVPGFKLVAGRKTREWEDEQEAEKALRKSLKVAEIFNKKLISPAQSEKKLGKKYEAIKSLITLKQGQPVLAPDSDRRKAIVITHDEFENQEEN